MQRPEALVCAIVEEILRSLGVPGGSQDKAQGPLGQLEGCLSRLKVILVNANEKEDDKYRRIRHSNAAFHSSVGRWKTAVSFLKSAGFQDVTLDGEAVLRMPFRLPSSVMSFFVKPIDAALASIADKADGATTALPVPQAMTDSSTCISRRQTTEDSLVPSDASPLIDREAKAPMKEEPTSGAQEADEGTTVPDAPAEAAEREPVAVAADETREPECREKISPHKPPSVPMLPKYMEANVTKAATQRPEGGSPPVSKRGGRGGARQHQGDRPKGGPPPQLPSWSVRGNMHISGRSGRRKRQERAAQEMMANVERQQCRSCGRNFHPEVFRVHAAKCRGGKKRSQDRRPAGRSAGFDDFRHYLRGTPAQEFLEVIHEEQTCLKVLRAQHKARMKELFPESFLPPPAAETKKPPAVTDEPQLLPVAAVTNPWDYAGSLTPKPDLSTQQEEGIEEYGRDNMIECAADDEQHEEAIIELGNDEGDASSPIVDLQSDSEDGSGEDNDTSLHEEDMKADAAPLLHEPVSEAQPNRDINSDTRTASKEDQNADEDELQQIEPQDESDQGPSGKISLADSNAPAHQLEMESKNTLEEKEQSSTKEVPCPFVCDLNAPPAAHHQSWRDMIPMRSNLYPKKRPPRLTAKKHYSFDPFTDSRPTPISRRTSHLGKAETESLQSAAALGDEEVGRSSDAESPAEDLVAETKVAKEENPETHTPRFKTQRPTRELDVESNGEAAGDSESQPGVSAPDGCTGQEPGVQSHSEGNARREPTPKDEAPPPTISLLPPPYTKTHAHLRPRRVQTVSFAEKVVTTEPLLHHYTNVEKGKEAEEPQKQPPREEHRTPAPPQQGPVAAEETWRGFDDPETEERKPHTAAYTRRTNSAADVPSLQQRLHPRPLSATNGRATPAIWPLCISQPLHRDGSGAESLYAATQIRVQHPWGPKVSRPARSVSRERRRGSFHGRGRSRLQRLAQRRNELMLRCSQAQNRVQESAAESATESVSRPNEDAVVTSSDEHHNPPRKDHVSPLPAQEPPDKREEDPDDPLGWGGEFDHFLGPCGPRGLKHRITRDDGKSKATGGATTSSSNSYLSQTKTLSRQGKRAAGGVAARKMSLLRRKF
ncbi:unnamed protein product [Vitrella brassicaformis CCMP3155]|uniref:PUB domain-containing protein n=2 Tax=Vitrella brassicaformis TaxID=1169539 RepID=A0A0G4F6D4_VITBC|nr:unnamed protein product [Vitrella brassicaformis CCMP3155]|eukprot:CEM07594.1 unnamed protein product [Vitrella brassicaformis CCMP3155]